MTTVQPPFRLVGRQHLTHRPPASYVPHRVDGKLKSPLEWLKVIHHGRQRGFHAFSAALESCFGWVLTGNIRKERAPDQIAAYVLMCTSDELLQKFWEVERFNTLEPVLSTEEKTFVQHFHDNYYRGKDGRYIVLLPRKTNVQPVSES